MRSATGGANSSAKRKRVVSQQKPVKRARSESSEEDGQAQILLLEHEIFESKKNYNNIATLIGILKSSRDDTEDSIVAAISLCRVFTKLMVSGDLVKEKDATAKETVVLCWLQERYSEYKAELISFLAEDEAALTVLTLCMRLLKTEGQHFRAGYDDCFPTNFLTAIVRVLIDSTASLARKEFSEKYVEEYDDVRFYTLESVENILRQDSNDDSFDNVLEILTAVESVPESKNELEDFYVTEPKKDNHVLRSLGQHMKRAQSAWLALLQLEMNKEQRKSVLRIMTNTVAPWFTKPELLMDFLTDSYDAGGSTSLLALSGLFYLIQERNLDYPSFYKKLYSLLDTDLLHSKHRSRFFRLLDTFLDSSHLPAVLVASFIKRLARLTLCCPPSGVVAVVPWIYNLFKKHPTCTFMIHRLTRDEESISLLEAGGMDDPFSMDEEDPMETKAIESSLWELVMLQSHYHPNVATLAKIISEQFTKQSYNIEDFLDHSYGSMLEAEHVKEVKKTPVIEFEIPKKIFTRHETTSGRENSLLAKLWDFS